MSQVDLFTNIVFKDLFKMSPGLLHLFQLKNEERFHKSQKFRQIKLKMITALSKVVENMSNLQ